MAIPDPTQSYLQGFQIGANVIGQRMDREQRIQELRSMDAARQAQERATAQTMAMQLEARNRAIDYSAKMSKALGMAQMASNPVVMVPGVGAVPNPNPMPEDRAVMQFVMPVVGEFEPGKVVPMMQDIALRRVQMETQKRMGAAAGTARPLAPENAELAKQRAITEQARQAKLKAETVVVEKGKVGVDPEFIRTLEKLEALRGKPFSSEERDQISKVHLGLESRKGAERPQKSRQEYVSSQLPSLRRSDSDNFVTRTDKERISELEAQYDQIYKTEAPVEDELIWVVDPQGKRGRVPKSKLEKALQQGYKLFEG